MQQLEPKAYQSITRPWSSAATTTRRTSIKTCTHSSVITMTPVPMLRLSGGACPRTRISLSLTTPGHKALAYRLRSPLTIAAKCKTICPTSTPRTARPQWQTYLRNWRRFKCALKSLISTLIPMNIKTVMIKWHTKKQILISTQCPPVQAKWWSAKSCYPSKKYHSGKTHGLLCHNSPRSLARHLW